jgi:hypothetical protein
MGMWANLKEFLENYKSTLIKACLAFLFIFLVLQYNTYGKRSIAHYLLLEIRNGGISEICIAPSERISHDKKGTYAMAGKYKIYIDAEWADIVPRDNLYLAMPMRNNVVEKIYEIDDNNARLILDNGKSQGCRSFFSLKKSIVQ